MNKCYQFKKENEGVTDLFIFGDITSWEWLESDVSSFSMMKEMAEVDTPLVVHINSYGDEVAEGLAMYNLLKQHKHEVTTICEGFACSAASVIFMAGTKRIMPKTSLLLIHNAWSNTAGDSVALKKAAEDLEKITMPSIEIYKSVSNLDENKIREMMDREEWITADEALAYGFATEIKEEEAKQSLHDNYLRKVVMRNKELENQILNKDEKPVVDGWTSFFNGNQ